MVGRSREGAWIEINFVSYRQLSGKCRSREGAWIEIDLITKMPFSCFVAPARERGLKWQPVPDDWQP